MEITCPKLNFLYSLPDFILIKGIELFLENYDMADHLKELYKHKTKHQYLIMRETIEIANNNIVGIITYGPKNYKYVIPYISIANDYDAKACDISALHLIYFRGQTKTMPNFKKFNIYYGICVRLNRKLVIGEIIL
jgi:hypothetical protein